MDDGPAFLKPRLRLFISADIVGSTALKQARPEPLQSDRGGWAYVIQSFYIIAEKEFLAEWAAFDGRSNTLPHLAGPSPEVWKTIGDEILFVKELTNSHQVFTTISCWLKALKAVRAFLQKGKRQLDVKCNAWIAGFPYLNKDIIVSGWGEKMPEDTDDYYKVSGGALNRFYENRLTSNVKVDFVGPSLDTGFRLSSYSTHRKFIVSVDVAYIMSVVSPAGEAGYAAKDIYFDGSTALKGVISGGGYPIFWIDAETDELALLEDVLLGTKPCIEKDIVRFCNKFYDEYYNQFILKPFISDASEQQITKRPDYYSETVSGYIRSFLAVDTEAEQAQATSAESEPENDSVVDARIDEVVQELQRDATP